MASVISTTQHSDCKLPHTLAGNLQLMLEGSSIFIPKLVNRLYLIFAGRLSNLTSNPDE